jgi:hypothetical protein
MMMMMVLLSLSLFFQDLLPCFQHIDRLSIHQHAPVITDEERTCANEPIDLTKPVDKTGFL